MRHPAWVRALPCGRAAALALLLLGGCEYLPVPERRPVDLGETDPADAEAAEAAASAAARQRLLADPRIGLAPMDAESRAQLSGFFARPNPKAFAFSPERGTNRHAWGSPSVEAARRTTVDECERFTGTPCVLFAVNDEIVWQPGEGPAPAPPTPAPPRAPAPAASTAVVPTAAASPAAASGAADGASAYLVGLFDNRDDRATLLEFANPTGAELRLYLAFFGDDGTPLTCRGERLAGNGLVEVDVARLGVAAPRGVVRAVTLAERDDRPQAGAVGYQRLNLGRQPLSVTPLRPVQESLLEAELPAIERLCRW